MRSPLVTHFDAYPDRAQYKPNQSGNLFIELETREDAALQLVVAFSKLERPVAEEKVTIQANKGVKQIVPVPLFLEETVWSGYGVKVTVLREGEVVSTAFTSYDIADHWSRGAR
ncbi:hypothetical protein HMSSN139_50450 [Paenibacillus sp. HMSSN-139]|nr:hypothetical protein HMSSN139_50450 [Paenibacillus sp. HMSSN-139]